MALFNVTGLVDPKCLPSDEEECEGFQVTDAKGDDREVHFCFGNVDQGCHVYVQAQVAARTANAACAKVEKVVVELLVEGSDKDWGYLEADEAAPDGDYGC